MIRVKNKKRMWLWIVLAVIGIVCHFEEIGKHFPDIDLAILENGQYNEGWNLIHLE